jgi:hypothetical protein
MNILNFFNISLMNRRMVCRLFTLLNKSTIYFYFGEFHPHISTKKLKNGGKNNFYHKLKNLNC